jgi:hypothetical protein
MNTHLKAMLASYARSFLAAGVAVYATGNTDLKAILVAGISATLPVAIRAINPKDAAFGIGADLLTSELNKLVKADKKKVVKKAVKKKD